MITFSEVLLYRPCEQIQAELNRAWFILYYPEISSSALELRNLPNALYHPFPGLVSSYDAISSEPLDPSLIQAVHHQRANDSRGIQGKRRA